MTGKEHYEAAEAVLADMDAGAEDGSVYPVAVVMAALAKAQVHATLALVWATAPGHAAHWAKGKDTAQEVL